MQVSQHIWDATSVPPQWSPALTEGQADLLLLFASVDPAAAINTLQQHFPETPLCGCSASGEIHQQRVIDNSITLTVIRFAHTRIRLVTECVDGIEGSRQAGIRVAQQLQQDDLIHILVFANGLSVNGSQLVAGLNQQLAPFNHISGGIAADGERFIFHNERALYLAHHFNIEAIAYNAKDVKLNYGFKTQLREKLARCKMMLDLLFKVEPKYLGDPIKIE